MTRYVTPFKGNRAALLPATSSRCTSYQPIRASAQPAVAPNPTSAAARVRLGDSDLNVSQCCLGTMTWGNQNSEEEAHQQLDYAWESGINFLDTAEM